MSSGKVEYDSGMSDESSKTSSTASAIAQTASQYFFKDPTKLLQAASDPVRWTVLRELASGRSRSVQELGAALNHDPDLISKHLRVLRDAGAVEVVASPDGDRRKQHHAVPEMFRRTEDTGRPVLDYGVCVLRFP